SSLLSKINQQNQTIYNNADPKMSVQVSRAKTTVTDSSYWTVEIIREKAGLGDLSLAARREKSYGPPNRIYNIYVDNGIVKTAIREYPDYLKEKWKTQFELGNGSAVAIAFDGEWEFYRKKWQLKTYENPWLFWVDGSGKLQAQLWDDATTKVELASSVVKVKAIRGWKNVNFLDRDHGVIAGYIKSDGKLYYRNYCTQLDGTTVWESERQVVEFTGIAVNLNLFITNDYRVGFVVEDNLGKIHWIITDRNWAGMAIAPEKLIAYPYEIKLDLIELDRYKVVTEEYLKAYPYEIGLNLLFSSTENSILLAENLPNELDDWGWIIEFKVQNPITDLTLDRIIVTDMLANTPILIENMEDLGNNKYRLNVSNIVEVGINNVLGDIQIGITNVFNEAGYQYESIDYTFTPQNLVPTEIPLPEVEVIWNE
ncbi:MAG TPA: hypothetical protein VFC79_05860, partial [Tissierellaceae bacterium]|nr:hypothetical protein [Tissierellaceae bacterium]